MAPPTTKLQLEDAARILARFFESEEGKWALADASARTAARIRARQEAGRLEPSLLLKRVTI